MDQLRYAPICLEALGVGLIMHTCASTTQSLSTSDGPRLSEQLGAFRRRDAVALGIHGFRV